MQHLCGILVHHSSNTDCHCSIYGEEQEKKKKGKQIEHKAPNWKPLNMQMEVLHVTTHKLRQIAERKVLPVSQIRNDSKPLSAQYKLL